MIAMMPLRFIATSSPLAFLTVITLMNFTKSVGLGVLLRLFSRAGGRAADVEGTHGELRARLTNGLCGNDSDRFAALDHAAGGEVASVAELANSALRFAGQHGADFHALDTGRLNRRGQILGDFLVDLNDGAAFVIELVFKSHAADDAVAQRLNDFARFDDGLDVDSVAGAAIVFGDDHVLGNVAKAARQVAGIGGLERGIGQTFSRAVRGDEVLQARSALRGNSP